MSTSRKSIRAVVAALLIVGMGVGAVEAAGRPSQLPSDKPAPRFEPTWESLETQQIPEWYVNAKFGIFIHWGVYSVPAFGNEWYPRNMYIQKPHRKGDYFGHHVQTYGPHKTFGYKDFIPKFRAEKFNATQWAKLFKKSGARYIVPVAEHHDGFPMYDCSRTEWCAAKMGPKRDIIAELGAAVRKESMHYGVSSHRAFNWAYYPRNEAFDTVDPANVGLYGRPNAFLFGPLKNPWPPQDKAFMDDWLARTKELVDTYQPDLMWFDFGIAPKWVESHDANPFAGHLKQYAAYYYNRAAEWGKGVAINYKHHAFPAKAAVLDIERGKLDAKRDLFWQTDTSVSFNSWGYITEHQYKPVDAIVDDLVDIVAKNGCMLLNIGPKADGTIPAHEQQMLRDIGRWLMINGEAIYDTRAWEIYGEGPTGTPKAFREKDQARYTPRDIRFTTKGDVLYATLLAWPGEKAVITSLGDRPGVTVAANATVRMLGAGQPLKWSQNKSGLTLSMPDAKPCEHAFVLKITGVKVAAGALKPPPTPEQTKGTGKPVTVTGAETTLPAPAAVLHGSKLGVETREGVGFANIGFWDNASEWVSWKLNVTQAGTYEISGTFASSKGGGQFSVEVAGQKLTGKAPKTRGWDAYEVVQIGEAKIGKPGAHVLSIRPNARGWAAANLASLTLKKM